jgi:thiosulfate/3-mercaptopyruvate sulfurtransferase
MSAEGEFPLANTEWLSKNLDRPDLRIVDVRWCSRYENGRGISFDDHDAYLAGHIPNAVFLGVIAELCDKDHPIPDMIAPPGQFSEVMGRLGIGNDTHVVTYDNMGLPLGAARLWWALKLYGHQHVQVLDGGLRQWQLERRAISKDIPDVTRTEFKADEQPGWLATKEDVVEALDRPDTVLVDCLTPELYRGDDNRHLWGQRAGHIPGAVNVPYLANIDPKLANATTAEREALLSSAQSFTFATPEKLSALYKGAGVTPDREIITYCGRGNAAACGLLALRCLGYRNVRLYDGSWTEWSADKSLPVETGFPRRIEPSE